MKITVNQLRRIIKEEVQRTLRESVLTPEIPQIYYDVYNHLYIKCPDGNKNPDGLEIPVQDAAIDLGMSVEDLKTILLSQKFEALQQERYGSPISYNGGETITLLPV